MALEHANTKLKTVKELLKKEQDGNHYREKVRELEEGIMLRDQKLKEIEKQSMEKSQLSSKTKESKSN